MSSMPQSLDRNYSNRLRGLDVAVVSLSAVVVFLVVVQRLLVADAQIDVDEEVYFQIAHFWKQGGIPYREIFDHKAPMLYFFYVLTTFGGMLTVRVIVTCLLIGSTAQMFCALVRRELIDWRQALLLGATLCYLLSVRLASGTNSELIYTPFEMLSFGLLLERRPYLSSICAAFAIAIKYTAIADILGIGIAYRVIASTPQERQSIFAWGATLLVLSAVQFGAFYVYFRTKNVDLFQQIVYLNIMHASISQGNSLSPESVFKDFGAPAAIITATLLVVCRFKLKGPELFKGVLPWLALSLAQACITRQYYIHYFFPVFVPLTLIWGSFKLTEKAVSPLLICLLIMEGYQVFDHYTWFQRYRFAETRYRELCSVIDNRGYIITWFLAGYRICGTPAVDMFMFPPFYLDEHFVMLSGSGGMDTLRRKLETGSIKSVVATQNQWPKLSTQLGGKSSAVTIVPDETWVY